MTEMNRHAREFIQRVRCADEPPLEAKNRVRVMLRSSVAAGGLLLPAKAAMGSSSAVGSAMLSGVIAAVGTCAVLVGVAQYDKESQSAALKGSAAQKSEKTFMKPVAAVSVHQSIDPLPQRDSLPPVVINGNRQSSRDAALVSKSELPSLSEELERLRLAHSALEAGHGQRALSILEATELFPELDMERAALRILALCAVGRTEDARRLKAKYLDRFPRSPMSNRIEHSCATSIEGAAP